MYDIIFKVGPFCKPAFSEGFSLSDLQDFYGNLDDDRGFFFEINGKCRDGFGLISAKAAESINYCMEDEEDKGGFRSYFTALLEWARPDVSGSNLSKINEFRGLSVLLIFGEEYVESVERKEENEADDFIFVYKEYNDAYAYGEELIKVFDSQADAESYLASRFCDQMGAESLEGYRDSDALEEDTVEDDYISIATGDGCMYWIIEAHRIIKEGEEV